MNRVLTPFRVGMVVLLGALCFAVLLSFVWKRGYGKNETYRVTTTFADASGLGPKSRVQIAGIEVGVVDRIDLTDDAHAKVLLRIKKNIVLHADARIAKRSATLLGDFVLDIFPGSPGEPVLKDGDEIKKAIAQPGVEDVFIALGDVTRDIQGITKGLKDLLSSDEVGSIKDIIRSMNAVALGLNKTITQAGGRLDSILEDAQVLTSSVRSLANNQSGNVAEILANVRTFTEQANRVINGINAIVGNGGDQLKESVASVRDTLNQLQHTLQNASTMVDSVKGTVDDAHKIVEKVGAGEGTLGKLLTDDSIANNLNHALGDVNTILSPLTELRLRAQLLGEVHYRPGLPAAYDRPWLKGGVALKLHTDPTFYYGVDLVNEPRGSTTREVTVSQGTHGENTMASVADVTSDQWKVSAYISKRLGPVGFRAGVIESTGGVGMDGYLVNDHIKLSVDAFDFSNVYAQYPRLRAQAQFLFLGRFFLGAGVDDILNEKPVLQAGRFLVGTDGFVTAGVQFTDEDVRSLVAGAGYGKGK
jgi:phospholipid/cholesterol/gamma-HCH transport system substrate-binding protein